MIKFCEIENKKGKDFLKEQKANKEQIFISDADNWYGAFKDNKLVGVVANTKVGKKDRIKMLFVESNSRKLGIGLELIEKIMNKEKTTTAFASKNSVKLFVKKGFEIKSKRKNNIYFVERKDKNV